MGEGIKLEVKRSLPSPFSGGPLAAFTPGTLGTVKIHEVPTQMFPRVPEHVIFTEMYFFNHGRF